MLSRRIAVGAVLIAVLVGVCWLDHGAPIRGLWLLPLGCVLLVAASAELLQLMEAAGMKARPGIVYGGNLLVFASSWIALLWTHSPLAPSESSLQVAMQPPLNLSDWPLLALAFCLMAALFSAMRRFEKPGEAIGPLAATMFAVVYLGLMFGCMAQLRIGWGMGALASLILVVKLSDTGAYLFGRLIGRQKITPVLSPAKTLEGAIGAIVFAVFGAWLSFTWLTAALNPSGPACPWWGWLSYGILLAVAGIFGDLAESLIKRDAKMKNSSTWLPGLGGVLDILDSLLLAAPVAWLCWALRLVQG